MKKILAVLVALTALAAASVVAAAEENAPRKERPKSSFRIDYVLYEVESGKRVNERSYSLTAIEGAFFKLVAGSRVPISAGDKGPVYADVGLKIRGRVNEREEGDITLESEIEMSNFAFPEQATQALPGTPLLRNLSQEVSTRLTPGRPAVISSVDDVNSRKRLQVEVTLTRVK
jgi:hypothetical protein